MNDVLKSLTIFDQTGNSVSGVRYDSSLPIASKLAEFPFQLGDRTPLTDFLDQLKGATIELKMGATTVSGQVVGARVAQNREKASTWTEMVNVLLPNGEIQSFDLGAATSVKLGDPELQRQLSEYLRSLNASRSKEQKSVYIDSARDAARKLSVAYTIPMPVWKSSYRLVLDSGAAKKPVLEGWAIIDNTTGEDWSRVDLSVISGRPISFISNLYAPKFLQRSVAELEEEKALAPKMYKASAGLAGGVPGGVVGGVMQMNAAPAPSARFGTGRSSNAATAEMQVMADTSSVQVETTTREAGELFEYKFSQPVSVKRNESTMIPFVQQEINARKLLIYSENSTTENPLNSAELTNSTGKTLDGGPLSVYDGGIYAGEALVNTFKAGEKRLLSYAADLGTRVVEDSNFAPRVLVEIKAANGILSRRYTTEVTKTYKITNVDKKPKTLMIEHGIKYDYKLLGVKPSEQTATAYRFEVKLTGEPAQSFVVKEEQTVREDQGILNLPDQELTYLLSSNRLSAEGKRVIAELAGLRRQMADADAAIRTLTAQSAEAAADQERVRRNLSSLQGVAGQQERVQKYASDLAALDAKIVGQRDQIAAETKKRDGLRQQIAQKIDAAQF